MTPRWELVVLTPSLARLADGAAECGAAECFCPVEGPGVVPLEGMTGLARYRIRCEGQHNVYITTPEVLTAFGSGSGFCAVK